MKEIRLDFEKRRLSRQWHANKKEMIRRSRKEDLYGSDEMENVLNHINDMLPLLKELFIKDGNSPIRWNLRNAEDWLFDIAQEYKTLGIQKEYKLYASIWYSLFKLKDLYDENKDRDLLDSYLKDKPNAKLPFNGVLTKVNRWGVEDDGLLYTPF